MILLGIDDTDTLDTRGTNQFARGFALSVAERWRCVRIVRHQLLHDARIPFTSQNGSASLAFEPLQDETAEDLFAEFERALRADFIPGSDPGICLAETVPDAIVEFGERCRREIVTREHAFRTAEAWGIPLCGLGGTHDGVIGALAAVGLAATGNDGRVVYCGARPDDLSGPLPISVLNDFGVRVVELATETEHGDGLVDVGKKLRPNRRGGIDVLYVEAAPEDVQPRARFRALKVK